MVMPLALQDDRPFLRLPLTVGEIYGHSPFLPADDIAVDPNLRLEGHLSISKASGRAVFVSGDPADGDTVIALGKSLELFFPDQRFGTVEGRDSAGRQVQLKLSVPRRTAKTLDIAILFDRSGSTNSRVGNRGLSVHEAMKLGLGSALSTPQRGRPRRSLGVRRPGDTGQAVAWKTTHLQPTRWRHRAWPCRQYGPGSPRDPHSRSDRWSNLRHRGAGDGGARGTDLRGPGGRCEPRRHDRSSGSEHRRSGLCRGWRQCRSRHRGGARRHAARHGTPRMRGLEGAARQPCDNAEWHLDSGRVVGPEVEPCLRCGRPVCCRAGPACLG